MKNKQKEDEEKEIDVGSEISISRSSGGMLSKDSKNISITLKSKVESIGSLLKKIPGVI